MRDALRGEERQLALPIEPGGGDRCVREPVESDVVEDIVARQALCLTGENPCDECITARVVIEHPSREADWRILDPVKRLGAIAHFLGVAQAVLVEEV